jgi:transposase InsO family protein
MLEAQKYFIQFHAMVNTQFNRSIKIVRSDNGLEFTVGYMFKFFSQNGISHQTSCVDTPQQNGIVERKHCHLLEVARARPDRSLLDKLYSHT